MIKLETTVDVIKTPSSEVSKQTPATKKSARSDVTVPRNVTRQLEKTEAQALSSRNPVDGANPRMRVVNLGTTAGDDAITGNFRLLIHAEIGAAMLHKHIEFFKRSMIEKQINTLARSQLATCMLRIDATLPAAEPGFRPSLFQRFIDIFHGPILNFSLAMTIQSSILSQGRKLDLSLVTKTGK